MLHLDHRAVISCHERVHLIDARLHLIWVGHVVKAVFGLPQITSNTEQFIDSSLYFGVSALALFSFFPIDSPPFGFLSLYAKQG